MALDRRHWRKFVEAAPKVVEASDNDEGLTDYIGIRTTSTVKS